MDIKEYKKKYRETHKEEIAAYKKDYRLKHKEEINAYARDYYYQNQEKCKRNAASYYARIKDTEEYKEKRRIRARENYGLHDKLRTHIRKAIKRGNCIKNKHTEEILGCSIEQFKTYIASLFQEGMSWDNYGEWHLDHIKPISLAKTEEEAYQLCHYTNYQPLWAKDNLSKGNRF